jgi:hypothetical protein
MALLGLFYPEDKGTTILQNVGDCLPTDMAYQPRSESSTPVLHSKEFHVIKSVLILFIQGSYFI